MADRGIAHSGLTVLYEPPIGNEEPVADIIFVHGIQGHPYRTWRAEKPPPAAQDSDMEQGSRTSSCFGAIFKPFKTKRGKVQTTATALIGEDSAAGKQQHSDVFWPQDLLPQKCPDARILTWGYDSMVAKLSGAINKVGIFAHANNFMYALGRDHKPDRPIVFVAHSLGGVLVKEMLVNAEVSENSLHSNILTSTSAVVFMGTPHRGSQELASLGEVARKVASFMLMDTNPRVLDSLGLRNDDLVRSSSAFMRLWRKHDFRVKTFQEGSGLTRVDLGLLNKKVVPDMSSMLGDPREEAETLLGNHTEICRISSVQDPKFPIVAGELGSICQRLGKRPLALPWPPQSQDDLKRRIQTEQEFQVLIRSLSFEHMYLREHTIHSPEDGTCTWLLQHPHFQKWLDIEEDSRECHHGLLWIKGKPGSGKSSLLKKTMRSLVSKERLIASFFFDQQSENDLNRSLSGLFRSIIHQLVSRDEGIRQTFRAMDSHPVPILADESDIVWTPQYLKSTLRTLLMSSQARGVQILIFIDAIDECEKKESRDILMYFRDLVEKVHSIHGLLRVCVSSRPLLHISISKCLQLRMDQENGGDILAYISRRFLLSDVPDDDDWRRVKDTISRKARGVFLWAVLTTNLALDYLDQAESMDIIHRRLTEVPPELSKLYAEILGDLNYNPFITYRFFQWAILSTTSLRLREWYHIFPLIHQKEPPVRFSDLPEAQGLSENQLEQKIRIISRGLVEVIGTPTRSGSYDEADSEAEMQSNLGEAGSLDLEMGETRGVQVIHESVRHFFLYQNGFAVLLKSCNRFQNSQPPWIGDLPSTGSALKDILIHGHYSIMKMCLKSQSLTEYEDLYRARLLKSQKLAQSKEQAKPREKKKKKKKKRKKKNHHHRKGSPKSKRSLDSRTSSSRSLSSDSILTFASAGSSISRESLSHFSSDRRRHRRHRKSQSSAKKEELPSIILQRYLEEINSKVIPSSAVRAASASASLASNTSHKTIQQQTLPLHHYSTTQLFVHAKLAEDLDAKPQSIISMLEPKEWTRTMLLQENYRSTKILDFCIDIDLPSWVMVLLDQQGVYNTYRGVFDAFRRAFKQDSPETMSAIVLDDIKRHEMWYLEMSILDHIMTSDILDLANAWSRIVSSALRVKSTNLAELNAFIQEHLDNAPKDSGDRQNSSAAALERELGKLLGYSPSLRGRAVRTL